MNSLNSHIEVLYAENWHAVPKPIADCQKIDLSAPALVIEGISLPEGLDYKTYAEMAKHCPCNLFLRERTLVHAETATCPSCTLSEDTKSWKVPLPNEPIGRIVQKVSASFQNAYQLSLPLGGEEMERDLQAAEGGGLSYSNPRVFVIEHIHVDTVGKALAKLHRLFDQTPRAILKKEGLCL